MIKGTLYVLVTMFALTIITLIVIGAGAIEPKEESKDSATTIIAEEDTSDIDNKTDVLYAEITTESSVDTEVIEIPGNTEVVTTEEIDEEIVPETTYDTSPDILHSTEDELFCLAAAVCREAGGASTEIQMMVANVIINRVCSDIYPDSVRGVITQRKQYGTMWKNGVSFPDWATQEVIAQCYNVAQRVLDGERVCPANVLFQAEFPQGSGVFKQYPGYYFCYY